MTTAGTKIGLTVPTIASDDDAWGGILNASTVPQLDEIIYAAREDRNLVVVGGGKISWDGTNVTFTGDITIYNHVTGYTATITTAGSPIALNAAGKCGYVSINRKPSVNQTITSVTVVAAGALPNAVGDNGVFVLFWRSADGTIIVPWAKKELLVGDHWQFGAAQTWYERIASSRKPGFRSNTADTSQTIVDASATAPACVWIDGKLYANTSPVTLDLDTAGRNGLDTGSKAANTPYYKYAIPAVSGRTFDVVCSVTAPTTGPTGFTGWSYLGAFATPSGSTALQNFRSVGGRFQANREIATASDPGTTGATSWAITNCPVTAKYGLFQLTLTGTGAGETGSLSATNSTEDACAAVLQVNSVATYWWGWCPILTAQTVWLRVSTTTLTFTPEFYGWIEDPMEYK